MSTRGSAGSTGLLDRIVVAMNAVGTVWVLLLVLLINVDAFGRSFVSMPMAGAVEMVAISMALIVFCQLADTIRVGKLTRSDGYVAQWLASDSLLGRVGVAAFELLGSLFMLLVVIGTWPLLAKAYLAGDYIGTRGIFTFPEWPLKAIVVFGATMAGACFLARAWRLLRGRPPEPQTRPDGGAGDV